ncbi:MULTISPECIES: sulfite exporter TauE/SafE family protein [unclassified Serratia (in: enterobacteria)]|uniref:sulfite exporter TauE/SafE family protein n=1 Tax=unclassified Serratia (in: enterobacteria) TaxID=2647522 RepID=UPI00046A03D5|nr:MULTISPECIES: sulfite exporter TauE/SafE family protein [unclassified Serratia (in: enterobacteria)]
MDGLVLGPELLGILFLVAMFAGFIDSIAGGGGLLTVPALLAVGVPPTQALATNKLQSVGGSFSASLYFVRRRAVDLNTQKLTIFLTLVGSVIGAILVQHMRADILRQMLPLLVIGIGVYFLLTPRLGESDRQRRLSALPFGLVAGGCVGFYDGFFGPGAGSFYALAYVTLCGFNLAKATAHAKVLNFTSNLGSLVLFIIGGKVIWSLGLVMLVGQVFGARLGAHMVLTKGQKLIRPMIVVVSLIMSCKLLYDNHGAEIQQWLALHF